MDKILPQFFFVATEKQIPVSIPVSDSSLSAKDDRKNFTGGLYVSAEDDGEINTAGLYTCSEA
jgi:hypothetical protein